MKKTISDSSLVITNLHASVEGKDILKGVSITVRPGEVHAIMGPNGSGKSTLAYALMGHPSYETPRSGHREQKIMIGKENLIGAEPEERAKAGLFLAFQSPIAIPGVSVVNLLRTSYQALHADTDSRDQTQNPVLARRWTGAGMTLQEFMKMLKGYASELKVSDEFLARGIHDGFSGGEKKKLEMLQALVLSPKYAIFDEIDTGLDVDALKTVATGITMLAKRKTGVIVITHYQRILKYVVPDVVHVLVNGKIVSTGGADLAHKIEEEGYGQYTK